MDWFFAIWLGFAVMSLLAHIHHVIQLAENPLESPPKVVARWRTAFDRDSVILDYVCSRCGSFVTIREYSDWEWRERRVQLRARLGIRKGEPVPMPALLPYHECSVCGTKHEIIQPKPGDRFADYDVNT